MYNRYHVLPLIFLNENLKISIARFIVGSNNLYFFVNRIAAPCVSSSQPILNSRKPLPVANGSTNRTAIPILKSETVFGGYVAGQNDDENIVRDTCENPGQMQREYPRNSRNVPLRNVP